MNKNIEKFLYILIFSAVAVCFVIFCCFNLNIKTEFFCFVMQKTYITKLVYLSLLFLAAGFAAGYSLCAFIKMKVDNLCNAYQKRHENISIEKDSDKAKISALEAKIATLEAALESALNNK